MLSAPTVASLALFTGRAEGSFSPFAEQALAQATLLFSVTTKREEFPDDVNGEQLAIYAILEMADRIYLEQPYAGVKASPFSSESTGSYSYSVVKRIKEGLPTGLFWWDMATDELSLVERSLISSGAVSVFDSDSMFTEVGTGRKTVLGPADLTTEGLLSDNLEMSQQYL